MKNASSSKLPPLWIKFFSCFFLLFLTLPALYLMEPFGFPGGNSVTAFGLHIKNTKELEIWFLAIGGLLFLGGLTGLFILAKRSFAYDFGIFYCVATLVITIGARIAEIGRQQIIPSYHLLDLSVQYLLLLAFFHHLISKRSAWRNQAANKPGNPIRSLSRDTLKRGA